MVDLSVAGDFLYFDGLESVTLSAKDTSENWQDTSIDKALRRNISRTELTASDGKYVSSDVRFHFQVTDGDPVIGNRITDADGTDYLILSTSYDTLNDRWKCICRNLAIHYGLDEIVTIDEGQYARDSSYTQVSTWSTICRVSASITETSMISEGDENKDRFPEREYEIILATDVDLSPNHRIVDLNGRVWSVKSSKNKDDLAQLQSVSCRLWPENRWISR